MPDFQALPDFPALPDFQTRTTSEGDTTVVVVSGVCDLRSRDEMTAALLRAVQSTPMVIVDLAAVRFLDSSGLHALVTSYQVARRRAGSLHVVNATGTVATVLDITGISDLLRPPAAVRPDQPA